MCIILPEAATATVICVNKDMRSRTVTMSKDSHHGETEKRAPTDSNCRQSVKTEMNDCLAIKNETKLPHLLID